jgi:hypothetical protein
MKMNCGTTIFGLIAKNGITFGADSMARHHDGQTEYFCKLHVVHEAIIASEGLGILNVSDVPGLPDRVLYRADQWMAGIEFDPRVKSNANARNIAKFIETSHPFIDLIRRDDVLREFYRFQCDSQKGYLADFLVASASLDELLVIGTRLSMELVSQLNGPPEWRVVFRGTTHTLVAPFARFGAGKLAEIDDAFRRNGNCYQDMTSRTNGRFTDLLDGKPVSLDELSKIVRSAISLAARNNPNQVGPPFVVATLQLGKSVSLTSYSE